MVSFSQKSLHAARDSPVAVRLTLPNSEYTPSILPEGPLDFLVATRVALNLPSPKRTTCGWQGSSSASSVPMPKTPVDEHYSATLGQNDVGAAREILPVKAEPKPNSVQKRADHFLGLCVLPADAAHQPTALLLREDISHSTSRRALVGSEAMPPPAVGQSASVRRLRLA